MNTPTTKKLKSSKLLLQSIPKGTFAIGSGMIIGALTGYLVVIIVNHAVGDRAYAGFGSFWSLIFVVGPGLFLPLEQEISRAISHRGAHNDGSSPIIRIAIVMAVSIALVMMLIFSAFSRIFIDHVFHHNSYLQLGFIIGILSYALLHSTRGVLSGNHRFGPYGASLALEGTIRFAFVTALSQYGIHNVGVYGVAMGIAPMIIVVPFIPLLIKLITSGSPASKRELGSALSFLITSSVMSQALAYSSLFITNVIEGGSGPTARYFTNAFFIARIPVIGFMAVQTALLPKLSTLHALGDHKEFRHQFKKLLLLVVTLCIIGVTGIAVLGNPVGKMLFGANNFALPLSHLIVLSLGSCTFLVAQTLLQACIALQRYKAVSVAYIVGVILTVITSILFLQTDIPTTLWVSLSFSIGCLAVVGILYVQYEKVIHQLVARQTQEETTSI